jgi:hypothetical protein
MNLSGVRKYIEVAQPHACLFSFLSSKQHDPPNILSIFDSVVEADFQKDLIAQNVPSWVSALTFGMLSRWAVYRISFYPQFYCAKMEHGVSEITGTRCRNVINHPAVTEASTLSSSTRESSKRTGVSKGVRASEARIGGR